MTAERKTHFSHTSLERIESIVRFVHWFRFIHFTPHVYKQVKVPIYIARLTSKLAAETLARARLRGISAYGETLASSIGCTLRDVKPAQAIYYITNPPIRADPEAPNFLMKSLAA